MNEDKAVLPSVLQEFQRDWLEFNTGPSGYKMVLHWVDYMGHEQQRKLWFDMDNWPPFRDKVDAVIKRDKASQRR